MRYGSHWLGGKRGSGRGGSVRGEGEGMSFRIRAHIAMLSLLVVAACETGAPQSQAQWTDITGAGRNSAVLYQDQSRCFEYGRQVRLTEEKAAPPTQSSAPLAGATLELRRLRINNEVESAYNNCMGMAGWRLQ
jgi:hypothetical protein